MINNETNTTPHRWWPLWVIYVVLACWFTWPILSTGDALGIADWDPLLFHHAAVLKAAIEYHQWPLWNPWQCGGDVLWQNPQVPFLTPVYPLALLFGLVRAMKLTVLVHYLLGFAGMHVLLTRGIDLRSRAWVLFLGAAVTLAGGAALHVAVGHVTFLTYFFLPWLLFFIIRGVTSGTWRESVGAAAVLALMIWNGGTHMAFMAGVVCACVFGLDALVLRTTRPLIQLAIVAGLAFLLCAPKLLPVVAFIRDPGLVDIRYFPPEPDAFSMQMLAHAFLDPFQHHGLRFPGQNYRWHEYGNYVGNLGALLVVASIVVNLWLFRRGEWLRVSLAITALLLFALALGELGPWAPYSILRRLPVFSQFRLPSRYLLVFTPVAFALLGCTVRALSADNLPGQAQRWIGVVLLLATAFVTWRNSTLLEGTFPSAPLAGSFQWMKRPPAPRVDTTTDGFAGNSPMLRALMDNRSVLKCNEPLQLPGAVEPDQPIVFSHDASVSNVVFTPNRIEFRALAGRNGARVFMNQRYSAGWTSNLGRLSIDPATRLAYVTLPPDAAGRYSFRFVPPELLTGWSLWVVGIAVAVVLWRRPREHGGERNARRAVARRS